MSEWEGIGKSDDWFTPAYIFDALGLVFDLDVAAPFDGPRHTPCREWISDNSLERDWGGLVWMNPPFGGRNGLVPWLDKFMAHGNGIALTPDRTSAPWWQSAARRADGLLFTCGRVKFERPGGSIGGKPGSGVTLWAAGRVANRALRQCDGVLGAYFHGAI
jgi:hypothetical protein